MKRIINFRPTLYIASLICLSLLFVYSAVIYSLVTAIFSACLIVAINLAFFFFYKGKTQEQKHIRKPVYFILALLLSIITSVSFVCIVKGYNNANVNNTYYTVTGKISEISPKEESTVCILSNVTLTGNAKVNTDYKLRLFITGDNDLDIGNVLKFTAVVTDRSATYEGAFSSSYVSEGIKYFSTVLAEEIAVISNSPTLFDKTNLFIRDTLKAGLDKEQFAIAYGLLCGNADFMEAETLTDFRNAGVAHVFAVSGLHIGFLVVILRFLLDKLRVNKLLSFFITFSILFFYSGVCGFTSSSIRALIMASVLLGSKLLGEKYDGLSSICLSAIIILLINPVQLFCVGFQLSFMVVIFINLLSRNVSKLFKFLPIKIANLLGVAISAQIASIPICAYAFKQVSLISVLSNVIFVPLVSVIYTLLLCSTLIGGIFSIAPIALFVSNYVLLAVRFVITAIDYSVFILALEAMGVLSALYYLVFVILSDKVNLSKTLKFILSLSLSVIFACGIVVSEHVYKIQPKLAVIGGSNFCATIVSKNDVSVMVVSDAKVGFNTARLDRALKKLKIEKLSAVFVIDGSNDLDANYLTADLLSVVNVEKVYLYNECNENLFAVLEKSFKYTDFYSITDKNEINFNEIFVKIINGFGTRLEVGEKIYETYSKYGKGYVRENNIDERKVDLIVATDYVEEVILGRNYVDVLSFNYSRTYNNAENNGNYYICG